MCFTLSDLARLRELFDLYKIDFSPMECARIFLEIKYRKKIIKIMNRKYPLNQLYTVENIYQLLKNANYKQCDAIMLHINFHYSHYSNRPNGLRVFKELWVSRKIQITNSLQSAK
ncbi:MAG: hypothetical protein EOP00_11645 [Pedobacter sp.]|nr:MAG: hypothetical protein EOP00_11645 [Pedobacter sp.]